MPTLSQSLLAAAKAADIEAEEAIAGGNPENAEAALRRAAQFRRLATNHRAQAILSGDASYDPAQIVDPPAGITGAEIAALRAALDLTQDALAQAIDVSTITVSRWERDAIAVPHPRMLRLALEMLVTRRARDTAE